MLLGQTVGGHRLSLRWGMVDTVIVAIVGAIVLSNQVVTSDAYSSWAVLVSQYFRLGCAFISLRGSHLPPLRVVVWHY